MLEDVLQNRHHILLFIQFEVIQKKKVFEAYKSFCENLGEDVIEYSEFDFWFYYFLNGNFDLDYERKMEKKPPELADLPIDVVGKVIGKMEFKEKLIFRNVSKKCRDAVDRKPIIIETLKYKFSNRHARIEIDNQSIEFRVRKLIDIVKSKNNGEQIKVKEEIMDEDEQEKEDDSDYYGVDNEAENCQKMALKPLIQVLKNPNVQIKHFSVIGRNMYPSRELEDFIKSLNHQIHVESFEFEEEEDDEENNGHYHHERDSYERIMQFIPFMKPGILHNISILYEDDSDSETDISKLLELEQFKKAKSFDTNSYVDSDDIDNFSHFDDLWLFLNKVDPKDVARLKEIYFNSPTFTEAYIKGCRLDVNAIESILGGKRFPMADGKTLHVDVSAEEVHFYKK